MHAISHSLAQRAHRAPPATRTRARWQPYNVIQSLSARSSPAGYLHTPASSVSSASPTPPQALDICEHDRRNNIISPPGGSQAPRELPIRDAQKSKYVIGLVDQAVKSLCDIWHPQDIPTTFMTSSRVTVTGVQCGEPLMPLTVKSPLNHFHNRNTQLPSPISPSTRPSPTTPPLVSTHTPQQSDRCVTGSQTNLVPIKGFVHEVLRRSRTSGSVLQTALCYLEAIRSKVPELVEQEKMGNGVQGEPDLSDKIVQGDIEAEEWRELSLDSVMADFIHMDAAVDTDSASTSAMATVKVADSDNAPSGASSFTCQVPSSGPLSGLKSHLVQNLVKKPKVPSGPLPPLAPLPSPLLCPRRTFLASLILASKFTQDRCYSNKAWAKLSGLPPREIGRCERALGDALEWRLWVGKTPVSYTASSSNRAVVRSKSDSELFISSGQSEGNHPGFSTPPPARGLSRNPKGAGLRRASTVPTAGFNQDPLVFKTTAPELAWSLPWTPTITTVVPSSDSPPTPSLSHSPSSTDSSSGDRTIQMSGFIDITSPPGQFLPIGKPVHPSFDIMGAPHAYAVQPHISVDTDSSSGLSFPSYASEHSTFAYDNSSCPDTMYTHWTV